MTNEFMDTVDPRIERDVTKTGTHRRVHVPTHTVRWGIVLAVAVLALAVSIVFA